ncbi:MAG: alanine dehydrogenase [Flavobacteriales bacterium]|nr:alanine dehydrogenase [Flavobacteriales bacterium]
MAAHYRRIGIIREGKVPVDRRVPLTPRVCRMACDRFPGLDLIAQRSPVRAFSDQEYMDADIPLTDDLADRELIIGVKEVPVDQLLRGKSYLFFSHTIKKQPHNRKLLRAVLDGGITLIDHELLTDANGHRVLAFGHWAGVVGAYNALRAWNLFHGGRSLKPAHACRDLGELKAELKHLHLAGDLRIVITGHGRVGRGALEVLALAGIERVDPATFLKSSTNGPVLTVLDTADLYARDDGRSFDKEVFHHDPSGHHAVFLPYVRKANMYLACHFWDARGPKILTHNDLKAPDLALQVIADISCDVDGPIDSTLRSTTIDAPFFGYDRGTGTEVPTGTPGSITVMAVDNLPCELPRDASESFANDLYERVLPALLGDDPSGMIDRATIARDGALTGPYTYLAEYAGSNMSDALNDD